MTDWAEEKARSMYERGTTVNAIATALREARERAKEHGAVECGLYRQEGFEAGRQSILSQLKEPSEAMIAIISEYAAMPISKQHAQAVFADLVAVLDQTPTEE